MSSVPEDEWPTSRCQSEGIHFRGFATSRPSGLFPSWRHSERGQIAERRGLVRLADDQHVTIRLHRLPVDERDRIGLRSPGYFFGDARGVRAAELAATADLINSLKAASLSFSPSRMSIARRVFPSRLELNSF